MKIRLDEHSCLIIENNYGHHYFFLDGEDRRQLADAIADYEIN